MFLDRFLRMESFDSDSLGQPDELRSVYIHTHRYAHIHTYVHTYIHTCMHTYIQTYSCLSISSTPSYIFRSTQRCIRWWLDVFDVDLHHTYTVHTSWYPNGWICLGRVSLTTILILLFAVKRGISSSLQNLLSDETLFTWTKTKTAVQHHDTIN